MAKYNYFDALEALSRNARSAVNIACAEKRSDKKAEISELRSNSEGTLLALEAALFAEFLPPLERDGIAEYAHCLLDVISAAIEYASFSSSLPYAKCGEAALCVELSGKIHEATFILRKLRNPGEMPDIKGFREKLSLSLDAHTNDISRLRTSAVPKGYDSLLQSAGKLRRELSRSFDKLIEIMLNNI